MIVYKSMIATSMEVTIRLSWLSRNRHEN